MSRSAGRANENRMSSKRHFLVIGYGNTLRGDDGVGPHVAEAIGAMRLPEVHTIVCQQLSPEHAAPISLAETVIFVDAAVDASIIYVAGSDGLLHEVNTQLFLDQYQTTFSPLPNAANSFCYTGTNCAPNLVAVKP